MKTLIFLLLISTSMAAQQNAIHIKTTDGVTDAFRKAGRLLGTEGYKVETADINLLMITTEVYEKQYGFLGSGRVQVKFNLTFDEIPGGTLIEVTGTMRSSQEVRMHGKPLPLDEFEPIVNKGRGSNIYRISWDIMAELTNKYKEGEIHFVEK